MQNQSSVTLNSTILRRVCTTTEGNNASPLWSLSACFPFAGCRSAFAVGGWSPAAGQSSQVVGRCAPGNPSLNPGGWNSPAGTGKIEMVQIIRV